MHRGDNGDVGAKIAVVPNGHLPIILDGEIEIAKKVFADFGVLSVVKSNGPLNPHALSHFAQDFLEDCVPFLKFILMGLVVIHV